jgi:hypothetical protein
VALNARVPDIRKSRISQGLLREQDRHEGPVIVKSDLNYAGLPELSLGLVPAVHFRNPAGYLIYPTLAAVPKAVFATPDVVVEKFQPDLSDGLYHMHAMVFLGDRVTCTRMSSKHPIVNGATQIHAEDVEPHPEILAFKDQLGFDFGKFDYVIHRGRPILIDANKTVGRPPRTTDPVIVAGRRHRAEGLYAFFP